MQENNKPIRIYCPKIYDTRIVSICRIFLKMPMHLLIESVI